MVIDGKCHFGNVSFALRWEPTPMEIPGRACGCSFCAAYGAVWTSHPGGVLDMTITDPSLVSRYGFGTRTAEFNVCARCGVVPVVTSRIEERLYAVVNVNAFKGFDRSPIRAVPASLEEQDAEARLERRKRTWIAQVNLSSSAD